MLLRGRFTKMLLLTSLCLAGGVFLLAQTPGKSAAAQRLSANSSPDRAVEKGKKIFDARCTICHFSASTAKKIGPGMKSLYTRGKFADGKPVDDATTRAWIEKGGKDMPGFKDSLNAEQLRELIAYLKTL